jgi:hypothetical protein
MKSIVRKCAVPVFAAVLVASCATHEPAVPATAFRLSSPGMPDVFTLIATDLEPGALAPGLTKDEVLKALQGGRALRAASLVFRYAH